MLTIILFILALIAFLLATANVAMPRINLVALGLVFVTVAWLVPLL